MAVAESTRWVLWGYSPHALGDDGLPYPLKLRAGTQRDCNGERRRRENERAGWVMGVYAAGASPDALRLQCDKEHPGRSHVGEAAWCRNPLSSCTHFHETHEPREWGRR